MTWKKRQEYVRKHDIVEPSEWRINQNEFAAEFNGFLDNDNLRVNSLTHNHVERDTFTRVLTDQKFGLSGYLFTHTQSGWTNRADFLTVENNDTFWTGLANNATQASIFAHSWSDTTKTGFEHWGTWERPRPGAPSETSPLILERGTPSDKHSTDLPFLEFSTDTEALIIIDFHGTVSWMGGVGSLSSSDLFYLDWYDSIYESPYEDDTHKTGTTGSGYYRPDNYYYKYRAASTLCSMWRVVVDGMIVAETGMLGSEYQHHPIYLCGAIPVSSGSHRVELQAQFVWYSAGLDKVVQASGYNPTFYGTHSGTEKDTEISLRPDCQLRWPNLIAQIRSR